MSIKLEANCCSSLKLSDDTYSCGSVERKERHRIRFISDSYLLFLKAKWYKDWDCKTCLPRDNASLESAKGEVSFRNRNLKEPFRDAQMNCLAKNICNQLENCGTETNSPLLHHCINLNRLRL